MQASVNYLTLIEGGIKQCQDSFKALKFSACGKEGLIAELERFWHIWLSKGKTIDFQPPSVFSAFASGELEMKIVCQFPSVRFL